MAWQGAWWQNTPQQQVQGAPMRAWLGSKGQQKCALESMVPSRQTQQQGAHACRRRCAPPGTGVSQIKCMARIGTGGNQQSPVLPDRCHGACLWTRVQGWTLPQLVAGSLPSERRWRQQQPAVAHYEVLNVADKQCMGLRSANLPIPIRTRRNSRHGRESRTSAYTARSGSGSPHSHAANQPALPPRHAAPLTPPPLPPHPYWLACPVLDAPLVESSAMARTTSSNKEATLSTPASEGVCVGGGEVSCNMAFLFHATPQPRAGMHTRSHGTHNVDA
jgi:hypothetical protein